MKPINQTRVGNDPDAPGNCFSACVASILECSIDCVPDEVQIIKQLKEEYGEQRWKEWPIPYRMGKSWERLWTQTQELLRARGLLMIEVKPPFVSDPTNAYCIISAKSPRGIEHSCVGRGHEIIHDPHPDGGGVAEEDRSYIFFVVLDPAEC